MTHGVVGSLIIARMIMQGEELWQELYGPERKTVSALTTFVSENVTAIKNFAEYVAPGEVSSVDEIKPGQGAIVRDGLKKVAAYRDKQGSFMPARQPALISDAICTGIPLNGAGIVLSRLAVLHRRSGAQRTGNSSP